MTEQEWVATDADHETMIDLLIRASRPWTLASRRRLRLLACAIVRSNWLALTDPRSRGVVQAAEWYALGVITDRERDAADRGADMADVAAGSYAVPTWGAQACLIHGPAEAVETAAEYSGAVPEGIRGAVRCVFGNPFRPVWAAGSSLMMGRVPEGHGWGSHTNVADLGQWRAWRDWTVTKTAAAIKNRRAWAELPVLADALVEAGVPEVFVCSLCRGTGLVDPPVGRGDYQHVETQGATARAPCGVCDGAARLPNSFLAHIRGPGPHYLGCHAIDVVLGES